MDWYKIIKVKCLKCGDILEFHYSRIDEPGLGRLAACKCGAVKVDPAPIGNRIIGNPEDYEDLSICGD